MNEIIFDVCLSFATAFFVFVIVEEISAFLAQRELDLMDDRDDER